MKRNLATFNFNLSSVARCGWKFLQACSSLESFLNRRKKKKKNASLVAIRSWEILFNFPLPVARPMLPNENAALVGHVNFSPLLRSNKWMWECTVPHWTVRSQINARILHHFVLFLSFFLFSSSPFFSSRFFQFPFALGVRTRSMFTNHARQLARSHWLLKERC